MNYSVSRLEMIDAISTWQFICIRCEEDTQASLVVYRAARLVVTALIEAFRQHQQWHCINHVVWRGQHVSGWEILVKHNSPTYSLIIQQTPLQVQSSDYLHRIRQRTWRFHQTKLLFSSRLVVLALVGSQPSQSPRPIQMPSPNYPQVGRPLPAVSANLLATFFVHLPIVKLQSRLRTRRLVWGSSF